ncbi:7-carboxy-7-deazaguanine synthase QueE [Thalassoglobus sp. JC818]|uniref:7-carboxy-7-deazaguanine synthase QueE n=1 Tax=Thalassoglobus sp. JC818 TaxID=3232136 RepID=UPI00345B077E
MWISEIFHSIQGEGQHCGVPSSFVRTSGCNLRCWFCDTPHTSWNPEGTEYSIEQLLALIEDYNCEHVVLTGGEPLLVPDMVPLTKELSRRGHYITIETAGTCFLPVEANLMSISPKLANSTPVGTNWQDRHEARRHRPEVIERLIREYDYQFKFVVDVPDDMSAVEEYLAGLSSYDTSKVFVMPQGTSVDELNQRMSWLSPGAEVRAWSVSPRRHIELFGNTRGT